MFNHWINKRLASPWISCAKEHGDHVIPLVFYIFLCSIYSCVCHCLHVCVLDLGCSTRDFNSIDFFFPTVVIGVH